MKAFTLTLFSFFAVSVVQGQEPRLATLSQQKLCADQAKRAFEESDASKPAKVEKMSRMVPAEYTSHYDAKANVCYIMVRESNIFEHPDGQTFSNSMLVYDAFDGPRLRELYVVLQEG